MHLLGAVLALLGAWMILSVPIALLMGRFLLVANRRTVGTCTVAQPVPHGSFGSTAA